MSYLLIRLMLLAALTQFGISIQKAVNCHRHSCAQQIEKASRDVLKIDWKPISVFPEERKLFK